jgi:DNA-binding transcriptional ArsR family regulator
MADAQPDTSETAKIRALANPLRQRILGLILQDQSQSGISPREISHELEVPLSGVSYHVRVLADCEAITLKGTKPRRGSMQHFYVPSPNFMALPWVPAVLKAVIPDPS